VDQVTLNQAERELAAWAAVNARRDEVVRTAHRAGVAKNRIHAITGIARTTIDRILEECTVRKTGSSSWRFAEGDAQFLHVALFVRDTAGLVVQGSDDIPPRLAGQLPVQRGILTPADQVVAAGQWVIWWHCLLDQAVREARRGNALAAGQDPLARAQAVYAGRQEVFDPPQFGSLADKPPLRSAAVAAFEQADHWWKSAAKRAPRGGMFPWPLVRDAAEGAAAELGLPVGDMDAAVRVLHVEGLWSYLAGPGFALCSTGLALDMPAARELLHDLFTNGRGDPVLAR
jgi:hypothetical protein